MMLLAEDDPNYWGAPIDQERCTEIFPTTVHGGIYMQAGSICAVKMIDRSRYPNVDNGTTVHYCDGPQGRFTQAFRRQRASGRPIALLWIKNNTTYYRGLYLVVDEEHVESWAGAATKSSNAPLIRWVLKRVQNSNDPLPASEKAPTRQSPRSTPAQRSRQRLRSSVPTWYNRHHFRSRLEARHAILYDWLSIPWTYERETITLIDARYGDDQRPQSYTPDFTLRHVFIPLLRSDAPFDAVHVEVKPAWPHDDEIDKCERYATVCQQPILLAYGKVAPSYAPSAGARAYAHSRGLRFMVFAPPRETMRVDDDSDDDNAVARCVCSDALLLLPPQSVRRARVTIDRRDRLSDMRVYDDTLLEAFEAANDPLHLQTQPESRS